MFHNIVMMSSASRAMHSVNNAHFSHLSQNCKLSLPIRTLYQILAKIYY